MIRTTWGYTLIDVDTLPEMLTEDEFNTDTANKYQGDVRIAPEIKAAESAIRNYVGWHLSGELECLFEVRARSKNISTVFRDTMIQLPARYVSEVKNVLIDGVEAEDYEIQTNGILTVFNLTPEQRYSKISVSYVAGLPDSMMEAVKDIVMHRVTHALANSYGIQSESSGGVSITYSAAWANTAHATALAADNKEVLEPYRLQGVF